ncbi:MAG: 3-hydroxyacyl-CoA dehydrogenase NAD-binding domain-containing protein [Verrucomicrobium sp.]|nr:3-hydroxyacyl-CoA dehydrogenase NAD-binding domain-containing protein [Verrucomicrobium sp.]
MIQKVLVVGGGTMGKEIALQCARHGCEVAIFDASPAVRAGIGSGLAGLAATLPPGLLTEADLPAVLARIRAVETLAEGAAEADLAVECVPENPELKRKVFRQLSEACSDRAILATNTSSLVPSMFAESCRWPERLAAFHFHLPVATSNIVDVMPHPGTSPETMAELEAFARRIGQIPIRYDRESHAYIFNSIFGAMQRQAIDLVLGEVATVEDVDRAWMGIFRMPLGPFGMFDNIGLDTIAEISAYWAETLNDDAGRRRVAFLKKMTAEGKLGTKAGRGFYEYPDPAYARPGFLSADSP